MSSDTFNSINKDNIPAGKVLNEEPSSMEQQQPTENQEGLAASVKDIVGSIVHNVVAEELNSSNTPSRRQSSMRAREFDEALKTRKIKNPFDNVTPRVTQLIYWENPTHSGAVLATGLLFLIYTSYCSLFNTFCALASILLGANWVYVMGRKQLQALLNQKPANPHEPLLVNKPWYIKREEAEKYLDTTLEAVDFLLLEAQKIVLVDDPMRTMRYAFTFYTLWTLGSWFSFRTFFGIGLVLGFLTPITYQKNKVLIDEKLDQTNKFLHSHMDRGLDIAKQHSGGMYEKAKSFAANKGLVSDTTQNTQNTQNTKKEE